MRAHITPRRRSLSYSEEPDRSAQSSKFTKRTHHRFTKVDQSLHLLTFVDPSAEFTKRTHRTLSPVDTGLHQLTPVDLITDFTKRTHRASTVACPRTRKLQNEPKVKPADYHARVDPPDKHRHLRGASPADGAPMTEQLQPLEYQHAPPRPSRRMSLEETETGANLVFPVLHPAIAIASIALSLAYAAGGAYLASFIVRFGMRWQMPVTSQWIKIVLMFGVGGAHIGRAGRTSDLLVCQAGRIPRRLGFTATHLTWQSPTWRGVRERRWRLDEITDACCDDLRSVVPRLTGAEMRIRLRSRRLSLRFRLGGYKVDLAKRFIHRLNEARMARGVNP
jgi:hypothetical protein